MRTNLISSDPLLRANLPQNVWQYSNPKTWVDFLNDIMQKIVLRIYLTIWVILSIVQMTIAHI